MAGALTGPMGTGAPGTLPELSGQYKDYLEKMGDVKAYQDKNLVGMIGADITPLAKSVEDINELLLDFGGAIQDTIVEIQKIKNLGLTDWLSDLFGW